MNFAAIVEKRWIIKVGLKDGGMIMMQYEIYESLTNKQKEEFNYKFGRNVYTSNIGMISMTAIAFMAMTIMLVFLAYLIMSDGRFESMRESVQAILIGAKNITYIGAILLLWYAFFYVFTSTYRYYTWRKWLKKNNIRVTFFGIYKK